MHNTSFAQKIVTNFYKTFHKDPGKMLVHTGVIGWILSSAAQITAIAVNDKIPKEQKMFLVPQEFADACANILSFYLVTRSFTAIASKLVKCGKLIQKPTKEWLLKQGFGDKIGKSDFDLSNIKLPSAQRRSYELFKNGVDVGAATIGAVLSCNIITPLLRNLYASERQKQGIAYYKRKDESLHKLNKPQTTYIRPTMEDFKLRAYSANNSGLKI